MLVSRGESGDIDALYQLLLVSVDGVQTIDEIMFFDVRSGVSEDAHRIERCDGLGSLVRGIYRLRLIDDDDRIGLLDEIDGFQTVELVIRTMDDVGFLGVIIGIVEATPEGIDVDDHYRDIIICGEIADLTVHLVTVIDERLVDSETALFREMLFCDLEGFVHTFFDGETGDDDDEFRESVELVQGEHCLGIDVRLSCACFHLYIEVVDSVKILSLRESVT